MLGKILPTNLKIGVFVFDAPQSWQILFRDAATRIMDNITDLHHDIMFFLVMISTFVFYLMARIVIVYRVTNTKAIRTLTVQHHTLMEIVWTLVPAVILMFIALPSHVLVYNMDEPIAEAVNAQLPPETAAEAARERYLESIAEAINAPLPPETAAEAARESYLESIAEAVNEPLPPETAAEAARESYLESIAEAVNVELPPHLTGVRFDLPEITWDLIRQIEDITRIPAPVAALIADLAWMNTTLNWRLWQRNMFFHWGGHWWTLNPQQHFEWWWGPNPHPILPQPAPWDVVTWLQQNVPPEGAGWGPPPIPPINIAPQNVSSWEETLSEVLAGGLLGWTLGFFVGWLLKKLLKKNEPPMLPQEPQPEMPPEMPAAELPSPPDVPGCWEVFREHALNDRNLKLVLLLLFTALATFAFKNIKKHKKVIATIVLGDKEEQKPFWFD